MPDITISARTAPADLRAAIRTGSYAGPTGGLSRGFVQCNLVILPEKYASDFLGFCQANPKPCPLLSVGKIGDPSLPKLGDGIDLRTDISAYKIFKNGIFENETTDITDLWQPDLVSFALGCSFSFEEALEDAGLDVRHNSLGLVNPMYTTNIDAASFGSFSGKLVVTMRPFKPGEAIRAIQITSRYPNVHGAPIHFGEPSRIGIDDLGAVEFGGDAVPIHDGEVPVFWACGVTPQVAITNAKPSFCITHKPARMLVTDLRNASLSVN